MRNWRRCTKIESTVPHGSFPVASRKLHTSLPRGQRRVKSLCRSSGKGVCVCWGYRGCGVCVCVCGRGWVTNNRPLLSGSRIKSLTWKQSLIYSNSWEVLSVVPLSNERGRTNSWQGIFFAPQLCLQLYLTNRVWWTCMEQFAVNHIVNELQTTFMHLNPRLSFCASLL